MQRKTLILLTFLFSRLPGAQIAQTLFHFVLGGLLLARPQMGYRFLGWFFLIEIAALVLLLFSLGLRSGGSRRRRLFLCGAIVAAGTIAGWIYADGSRAAVFGLGILTAAAGVGRIYAAYTPRISLPERVFCAIEGAVGLLMTGLLYLHGGTFPEVAPWCGIFFCTLAILIATGIHLKSTGKSAGGRRLQ